MIQSFRHKGLKALFQKNDRRKLQADLVDRIIRRLAAMDAAASLKSLEVPGFDFHGLSGKPKRYSIHVNGPWCITFEWDGTDVTDVDLENYH